MARKPTKPWPLARAIYWGASGVYRYPTEAELAELAEPRGEETPDEAHGRILGGFAHAAEEIDRRTAALMTGAGLTLAINGLLLDRPGSIPQWFLVVCALAALIGFTACLLSFLYWVDRGPGAEQSFDNLRDARGVCIQKQFFNLVAVVTILSSLGGYGAALIIILAA